MACRDNLIKNECAELYVRFLSSHIRRVVIDIFADLSDTVDGTTMIFKLVQKPGLVWKSGTTFVYEKYYYTSRIDNVLTPAFREKLVYTQR